MNRMIFVNLPVADVAASTTFYAALGFTQNPQFSDETASCMVLSEAIYVMLLSHDKWRTFTAREIPDATKSAQVLLAISCESRAEVDDWNARAAANGGEADVNPKQDHGFMYGRDFADPDGHIWEPYWMDMAAIPSDPKAEMADAG